MPTLDQVRDALFDALDQLNQQLPPDQQLVKSTSTPLAGADGGLDSLGLVNLIAVVEQTIEERFGVSISLFDEDALGSAEPFATVGTLADFISGVLRERIHA
jgi:acyl carrier protein